jgi:hypothetical protein
MLCDHISDRDCQSTPDANYYSCFISHLYRRQRDIDCSWRHQLSVEQYRCYFSDDSFTDHHDDIFSRSD